MLHFISHVIAVVAAVCAACGMGYYLLCLMGARTFRRDAKRPYPDFTPPVSILKPLRGVDPEIYESFRSHCVQDYPEYEIIFGVHALDDPAVPLVQRLQREFPAVPIRLVVCAEMLGTNGKVSSLIQMFSVARHGFLLVNDSDIRVPQDYLRRVMRPLESPDVGMVTCLYRGQASDTLGSKLEAIGISTEFHAGVLSARQLEGDIRFALGSTLAFSRPALKAIGGLEPLVDYLADDYELGCRIASAGFRVVLSEVIVDTHLPAYSFGKFFEHQLRWSRSTRDSRKWGYLGLALTFAVPWAMLAVLASWGATWSLGLLAVTLALRFIVAYEIGIDLLNDRQLLRMWWLIPARDLIAVLVWAGSFAGHTVSWRGREFVLRHGKLHPVEKPASVTVS